MLIHSFTTNVLTIFFCIFIVLLWNIYYIFVNKLTTPSVLHIDTKKKKTINIDSNLIVITFNMLCVWLWLTNYIFIHNINIQHVLWNTIYISNNTLMYFYVVLCIVFVIIYSMFYLLNQNVSFSVEYVLIILLISLSSFFLISSTNLFLTIFLLELIALLIFGKFAVSRVTFKQHQLTANKNTNTQQISYGLFNSLFFQFWANFVSSVFLFFSLLNIHFMFGTSNLFFINFFLNNISTNHYFTEFFTMFISLSLVTGLFIKLGLAPYQFFKIETYKGIPLYMIIVYTTLYLLVYVYFFSFFVLNQVPSLRDFVGVFVIIFLVFSVLYLISLLFDTKNFKAFLSYSTLITIVNLFVIILVL